MLLFPPNSEQKIIEQCSKKQIIGRLYQEFDLGYWVVLIRQVHNKFYAVLQKNEEISQQHILLLASTQMIPNRIQTLQHPAFLTSCTDCNDGRLLIIFTESTSFKEIQEASIQIENWQPYIENGIQVNILLNEMHTTIKQSTIIKKEPTICLRCDYEVRPFIKKENNNDCIITDIMHVGKKYYYWLQVFYSPVKQDLHYNQDFITETKFPSWKIATYLSKGYAITLMYYEADKWIVGFCKEIEKHTTNQNTTDWLKIMDIFVSYDHHITPNGRQRQGSIFRKNEGQHLHIELVVDKPCPTKQNQTELITLKLQSPDGIVWQTKTEEIKFAQQNGVAPTVINMKNLNLQEGIFELIVYSGENEIKRKQFELIDIPERCADCFTPLNLFVYQTDKQGKPKNIQTQNNDCYYDIETLTELQVLFTALNLLDKDWIYELSISLYDSTGQLLEYKQTQNRVHAKGRDEERVLYIQESLGSKAKKFWKEDTYHIEIKFLDEKIAELFFQVGNLETDWI